MDEHGRAEPGEPHGRLEADAARGAGDQHGLAVHAPPGRAQPVQRRAVLRRHAHDVLLPGLTLRSVLYPRADAVRRRRARSYSITDAHPRTRADVASVGRGMRRRGHRRRYDIRTGRDSRRGRGADGRSRRSVRSRSGDAALAASRPAPGRQPGAARGCRPGRRARGRPAPARVRVGAAGAPRVGARRRGALVAVALAAQPRRRAAPAGLATARRARRPGGRRHRAGAVRACRRGGLGRGPRAGRAGRRRGAGGRAALRRRGRRGHAAGQPAGRPAGGAEEGRRAVHRVHAVLARSPRGRRAGRTGAGAGEAAAGACRATWRPARRLARRGGPPLGERVLRALAAGRARRARAPGGVPRRTARRLRGRPRPPRPRRQQPPLAPPALGRGHGAAGVARRAAARWRRQGSTWRPPSGRRAGTRSRRRDCGGPPAPISASWAGASSATTCWRRSRTP